ncbi:MAG: hypothetical protein AABX05_03670 [Nanoarchaeota archaeon]
MGLKNILARLIGKKSKAGEYNNRFLKFYHLNKTRLKKERKSLYRLKKKKGICVRCNKNAMEGIIFCGYHQQKQVKYNQLARSDR